MTDQVMNAVIVGGVSFLFTVVGGSILGLIVWIIKRWIKKVDDVTVLTVTTDDCQRCKEDGVRHDEEFKQEIRDGFSDIKVDLREFRKEHKADVRNIHQRIDFHFNPKQSTAMDSAGS